MPLLSAAHQGPEQERCLYREFASHPTCRYNPIPQNLFIRLHHVPSSHLSNGRPPPPHASTLPRTRAPRTWTRLADAAEVGCTANHSDVIDVLGHILWNGTTCIVTEFLQGESLAKHLASLQ